jgi:transcriptional regulator with XRE-family HTH domain
MNRYAISKNILRYLNRYGMTQVQLAEKIGVNPVTMSRWMNGVRPPTVYALKRIARALGCTIDDLVVGLEDDL